MLKNNTVFFIMCRHVTELVSNGINMVMNPIGQSDQNLPGIGFGL